MKENLIVSFLHDKGLSVSKQRAIIINELCKYPEIDSVDNFWLDLRKNYSISYATTYSTIRFLNKHGVLEKYKTDSRSSTFRLTDPFYTA